MAAPLCSAPGVYGRMTFSPSICREKGQKDVRCGNLDGTRQQPTCVHPPAPSFAPWSRRLPHMLTSAVSVMWWPMGRPSRWSCSHRQTKVSNHDSWDATQGRGNAVGDTAGRPHFTVSPWHRVCGCGTG